MELQNFIQNIVDLFDDIDTSNFSALTDFKDNDEWNSLLVLSVIAMVDEEYGIIITSDWYAFFKAELKKNDTKR